MNLQHILNPFRKINTTSLLIIGIISFLFGTLLAAHLGFVFDGAIDVHSNKDATLLLLLRQQLLIVVLLSLSLFVAGYAINRKTRVIDICNAVLIFRIPFYLIVLVNAIPFINKAFEDISIQVATQNLTNFHLEPTLIALLFFVGFLLFTLLVYAIILLFNGFKSATNAKKWYNYLLFALILLFVEILSKIILAKTPFL